MTEYIIRPLTEDELEDFFALRLESLKDSPESFLSSYEEVKAAGPSSFENIFKEDNQNVVLGAFTNGTLIGTLVISPREPEYEKHKCVIWGIYMKPDYRQQGIGKALLEAAISHVKENASYIALHLSVEASNEPAKKLYEDCGFKVWGVEEKAKKIGDSFYNSIHMVLFIE